MFNAEFQANKSGITFYCTKNVKGKLHNVKLKNTKKMAK